MLKSVIVFFVLSSVDPVTVWPLTFWFCRSDWTRDSVPGFYFHLRGLRDHQCHPHQHPVQPGHQPCRDEQTAARNRRQSARRCREHIVISLCFFPTTCSQNWPWLFSHSSLRFHTRPCSVFSTWTRLSASPCAWCLRYLTSRECVKKTSKSTASPSPEELRLWFLLTFYTTIRVFGPNRGCSDLRGKKTPFCGSRGTSDFSFSFLKAWTCWSLLN